MITGYVKDQEARIRLKLRGPRGREHEVEAVIDTGFTGALTLPPALVRKLKLPWDDVVRGTLADGSECLFEVYRATIVWDRKAVRVLVSEADADPLVGMELLDGYELKIQVRDGGKVAIKRLSQR
jgi:clan AA aspartic protease